MNIKQKLLIAGVSMVPILGVGGLALSTASGAASAPGTPSVATQAPATGAGTGAPDAVEPAGTSPEATSPEATSPEADGPGGHQDPSGGNVDHQFQGQE